MKTDFSRERLPDPSRYFQGQAMRLTGAGEWRSALCPFHDDSHPSLRVNIQTGAFRCMSCGAHGGDILAFHRMRFGLGFVDAARSLGAMA